MPVSTAIYGYPMICPNCNGTGFACIDAPDRHCTRCDGSGEVQPDSAMSASDKRRLSERLRGTCDSIESALNFLEIDADSTDAVDALLDVSTEQCKGCGWWHECCELDNERDGELGYCDQCEPKRDDEDE